MATLGFEENAPRRGSLGARSDRKGRSGWENRGWTRIFLFLACLVALSGAFPAAARIYFVSPSGSDEDAGTSWSVAFRTLTKASQAATQSGDEVWVAEGTYVESDTVTIPAGVSFYGGFAGGETDLFQRDWTANPAIIDGQNARQCVSNDGVLDGFSITRSLSGNRVSGRAGLGAGF